MALVDFGQLMMPSRPDLYTEGAKMGSAVGAIGSRIDEEQKRLAKEKAQRLISEGMSLLDYKPSGLPEDAEKDARYNELFGGETTMGGKLRRFGGFVAPHDEETSREFFKAGLMADAEDRAAQEALAKAEAEKPRQTMIRAEEAYKIARDAFTDADTKYQRYKTERPNDVAGIKALSDARDAEERRMSSLRTTLGKLSKGTPWEETYKEPEATKPAQNEPQAAPVAPVAVDLPKMSKSSDLAMAKKAVNDALREQRISPEEADRKLSEYEDQANILRQQEGERAGKAGAERKAKEDFSKEVVKFSTETAGIAKMLPATQAIASGQGNDSQVRAFLLGTGKPENRAVMTQIIKEDPSIGNWLKSKAGMDIDFTPEQMQQFQQMAQAELESYQTNVQKVRENWPKLTPAQRLEIKRNDPISYRDLSESGGAKPQEETTVRNGITYRRNARGKWEIAR